MEDPTRSVPVAVSSVGEARELADRARGLASELGLPRLHEAGGASTGIVLMVTEDGLELREADAPAVRGVRLDVGPLLRQRRSGHLSQRQPLARAIGRGRRRIVDATAGLGHDALLLALLGHEVIAVERSPVVAALLRDGLRRAGEGSALREALGDRLTVITGDARDVLGKLPEPPEAVYIDPMFPPKRKESALPKKSIQLLRRLVGPDADAGRLLETALGCALDRVVVKRPTHARPVGGEPSLTFRGKLVRYDVYLVGRSPGPEPDPPSSSKEKH